MGCASGKWGSELCLDTEAGLAWAAGQPALKFAEGTAPPAALKPWPGASLQGHPWLPRPLPPPGASLGSSQQELLLAISHGCFFLPHSFKIGSGEWALGEDPQIDHTADLGHDTRFFWNWLHCRQPCSEGAA